MYESFYCLTGKPFQLNPDPSFFFGSRGHKRAMAYLEYGLHQSEGFIVITGEIGAGKTTLVRNLLEKLDAQRVVAAHLVSTQLDADDILRMVAAAFGLPNKAEEKADLLLALEMFLVSVTSRGKRALLIVDEAQNLSPRAVEELRMLSNFQLEDHALLQSFLIGQPEFRDTMQSEHMQQLRQRVIASYHLGPMDRDETQAYVEHRLRRVGWTDNPRFDPTAMTAIYDFSGGIPRRINTLCDRLMLAGFLEGKTMFKAVDVQEVMQEIKDEAGETRASGNALLRPARLAPGARAEAGGEKATTRSIEVDVEGDRLRLDLLIRNSQVEERLQKLEQQMARVLALLQQLLPPRREAMKEEEKKL